MSDPQATALCAARTPLADSGPGGPAARTRHAESPSILPDMPEPSRRVEDDERIDEETYAARDADPDG